MPTERDEAPPGSFRVPVEHLVVRSVTAGMDIGIIAGLVPTLRKTTQDWEPVEVSWIGCADHGGDPHEVWLIEDGRHRFFASVIAGRPDVLCAEKRDE